MKRATKILCILAACLLGSGLLLLCAGLFAGGFHSLRAGALNLSPQGDDIQDSFLFEQVDALSIQCEIGDLSIQTDPDLPAGAVYVEYDLPAGSRVSAQMEENTLAFHSKAPHRSLPGLFQRLLRNLLAQGSLNAYPTACIQISVSPRGCFPPPSSNWTWGISPWTACAAKTWTSTLPWAPPSFPTCTPPPPPWFSWTPAA